MRLGLFAAVPERDQRSEENVAVLRNIPVTIEALTMSSVSRVEASIPAENSPKSTVFHSAISCDIPTACKLSGISRSYLYLVLARGDVRSVKAGRRRLVLVASLRTWLQSLPSGPLAHPANATKGLAFDRTKP